MTIHTMKKVSLVVMLFLLQKSFDVTRRLAVLGVLLFGLAVSQTALAQQIVQGSTADGSLYDFVVPTIWNHNLVVYAHGIVDPQAPIQLPADNSDFAPLRDALVARGYAVASSSWSENGYAVKEGVQRIHQLNGLFSAQFGPPINTLLIGKSLGGLVALKLAEQYPSEYNGALVMCGPVGGGTPEVKYLADARILFDYFFPGVLPGDAFHTPTLDFSPGSPAFNAVAGALQAGFFTQGAPTFQLFSTAHLPASNPTEIVISGLTTIGFNVRFVNDVLSRTHGHIPYDNTAVVYSGSFDDAALNAVGGVERFSSDPDAVNYISKYYDPSGKLQIPVLTLHTLLDPVAPYDIHEGPYAAAVATAGSSNRLVQQSVARYGHCAFQLQEELNAFDGLASWSQGGSKPAGGDVTLPLP